MGNSASPSANGENAEMRQQYNGTLVTVPETQIIATAPPPPNSTGIRRTASFTRKAGGIPHVMSSDSLAGRGRQLLETFEKVRSDHASRYGGDDERATIQFCADVLRKGAPDWAERFNILRTISCGTTSVVCLALDVKNQGEKVAMKYARLGNDPHSKEFRERKRQFEVEAKLQRRCASKHIAKLLDFRIVDMFAIFVMEYLPRTLLDDIVESNRTGEFPELRSARHVRAVAQALEVCHSLSIAHLDVKLDNILISANGEAKLCDFGLADIVPVIRSAATPLYAPPEILMEGRCNEKADMWSLGVCVYILLCGYPPFQPDDRYDLSDNICKARYSFKQEEGWAHVSALARDLVARLLVIDPEQRWSARQVLEHPWIVAAAAAEDLPRPARSPVPSTAIVTPSPPPRPVEEKEEPLKLRPPLLQRQQSVVNLERLAERRMFEEKQRHERSLGKFLEFADEVRKAWKESGWEGALDVGKRDPNVGNIFQLAEDIGRGWKEGGIQGAIKNVKSFGQLNLLGQDDRSSSGEAFNGEAVIGEANGEATSTSASLSFSPTSVGEIGEAVPLPRALVSTSASSSEIGEDASDAFPSKRNFERADSKMFLKAMYGSTSPLRPPTWVPDSEASVCRLCETPFTFFRRRHHCRSCGQVVCYACSQSRRIVRRVDPHKLVRVCDLCTVSSSFM